MAKGKNKSKKQVSTQNDSSPQSSIAGGYLYTQQAEQNFINNLTRLPDIDEVLRKVGISRHRLATLLYDDEIYQCVEKRQSGLESTPFRLENGDTIEANIIASELSKWWSEIVLAAQNARWYGYSVIEAVYSEIPLEYTDDQSTTPFMGWQWIGEKPMEWFEPKNDGRLMLLAQFNDQQQDIECDQRFKHFLAQCKATFRNPYGESLLSRLYWLWFFKQNSFKFWAKFVERFGNPLLVGKSTDNEAMRDALLAAHASSVIAVSPNDDITAINAQNNGSTAFEGFDKRIEKSIQKLILGQTLTSGTDGTGSRALGTVHLEIQDEKVEADIRMILPTIQSIVNGLCDLNQWPHYKVMIGNQDGLEADKASRDVNLKNAGAVLTPQYFQREYGLQEGDLLDPQEGNTTPFKSFTALPQKYLSFASGKAKYSLQQQQIEQITDHLPNLELLDGEQIKHLFTKSTSIEALSQNLVTLIPVATKSQFNEQLDHALYVGAVMGFCFADEVK